MINKHLDDITAYQWILTFFVAIWAVLSAYVQRDFTNTSLIKKTYFLFQDFVVSGGMTYLTFIFFIGYGLSDAIALPLAGFIGHRATTFSYVIENYIKKRLEKL